MFNGMVFDFMMRATALLSLGEKVARAFRR